MPFGTFLNYNPDINLSRITEKQSYMSKRANTLLEQYKLAVDSSSIFSKTDPFGTITYVNEEFCRLSKYTSEELIGKPHSIVRHPSTPKKMFKDVWDHINAGKPWKGVLKNLAKDGSEYYVNATIIPILDDDGSILEILGIRYDITELYAKDQIIKRARTDETTGLLSRMALLDDLKVLESKVMIVFDIVSFQSINDFYGYETGDALLNEIGFELEEFFSEQRYQARCYRMPIDIFGVLITKESDIEEIRQKVKEFIERIETWPLDVMGTQVYIQVAAGMSTGHDQGCFHEAEVALQYAKKNKKRLQLYNSELNVQKEIEKNFYISRLLNDAIYNDNVIVHYQPIFNNKTREYEKFEALVRIKDDNNKIISPGLFLEVAKKMGIYKTLTRHIIEASIEAIREKPNYEVSVNLTYEDISEPKNRQFLETLISAPDIAKRIVLEITETEEIKDLRSIKEFLAKMQKIGCKIAIDDFGSGYSNFRYMLDIDADYIKIDGSLITGLPHDRSSLEIVTAITSFAKKMNIKTIAEYVSSQEIFDAVVALGIDYSQGFYFSPPASIIQTEANHSPEKNN